MRLLFLTQYYPPETGAAQNRISDLAEKMAALGHTVTVLTAFPNYPQGKVYDGYRGRLIKKEQAGSVEIVRTWIYATQKKSFTARLWNYFSFVFTSILGALLKVKTQDLVVVESPPLFLGISGIVLSWIWKSKLVFNVSDLWPKSAVDLGVLKNASLIRISTMLEDYLYRNSDLITGQTEGIVSHIRSRVATEVLLYTNGVDPSSLHDGSERETTRMNLGFSDDTFVVGYVGLHGLAQGLDSLLLAAEKLLDHRDVRFIFLGDGPEKSRLQAIAQQKKLMNVTFLSSCIKSMVPQMMSALDVSIVPLRQLDLFRGALPNKLFESMGGGVPVIVSIAGEAEDLVQRACGGICIPPEDFEALARAIVFLRDNPDIRTEMGRNGRLFVTEHYDRRIIASKVEKAFARLMQESTGDVIPVVQLD